MPRGEDEPGVSGVGLDDEGVVTVTTQDPHQSTSPAVPHTKAVVATARHQVLVVQRPTHHGHQDFLCADGGDRGGGRRGTVGSCCCSTVADGAAFCAIGSADKTRFYLIALNKE